MTWKNDFNDWGYRVVVVCALYIFVRLVTGCEAPPQVKPGHIYDTVYGSTYCSEIHSDHACGIHLFACADGHEYFCLLNVRERE